MPRTLQEILDDQERIAAQFEAMEPTGDGLDGAAYRDLLEAAVNRAEAERRVAAAVNAAKDAGYTWKIIGAALGTSAQAAQQRYGVKVVGRA